MINDLRYAVTFPTNGVSLNGALSFQPGSTAISGRNGAGKSFIAEMIRYGLFGKRALRGPASDYKTLDMSLKFQVVNDNYEVHRGKKETLKDLNDEILAVGADAVNKKIVEILGFELEVFDVVCAANQKESERLTRLTPAKRKELIDDVVGLTRQEAVEKACREEAKGLQREAEALTRSLVLPVEPEKPKGYRPSEELEAMKELVAKREQLLTIVNSVGDEPVPPAEPCPDIVELEEHERERMRISVTRAAIERNTASIPDARLNAQQIADAEAIAVYEADIAQRGPRPTYARKQVEEWLDWLDKKELLVRFEPVNCPKCEHEFVPGHADIDVEEIDALPELPVMEDGEPMTRKYLLDQLARFDRWPDEPRRPNGVALDPRVIRDARVALARAGDKLNLEHELRELTPLVDRSAELAEARELERAWDIYDHTYEHWRERYDEAQEAQTELDQLDAPVHSVAELDAAFVEAKVYETQLANYSEQKRRFDDLTQEIAGKQERADGFLAGAKGLVEARRTLKAFLAPSLSRVASKIISEMTVNAERPISAIEVDEDMNITADGQDVATFNGAHATMINLALRLALGQVLVARVFPVFIGDELDSDADDANSQAIADALMTCTGQLQQIVVISHKRLEGFDQEVTL